MARVGPYGWLLASLVASVAVQGSLGPSSVQRVVVSVLLGANLLLAVVVADVDPSVRRIAAAIAAGGVALNVLRALTGALGEGEVRAMNALVIVLGPPMIALGVLRSLRASRAVRLEAVSGVLSLYIMIGLFFAFLFGALDHLGDEPFFAGGAEATVARCVYFSFVTLATVGYGDLTAGTDLGHTLCVFEALIGQIYLVTVVSLIVSNLGRRDGPAHPDRMMRGEAREPMLAGEVDAAGERATTGETTTMPGLLSGVARTAVVAGTATAVSNRVSRRQAQRWAAPTPDRAPGPPYEAAPPQDDPIAMLKELAGLRDQGILTDQEFADQKARLLA
jgi:hypothetical protein